MENMLNTDQLETKESLIKEGLVKQDNDVIQLSNNGSNLVKVFQSGIDYNVLFNGMSNRHLIALGQKYFDKVDEKKIHLNVIFKNMPLKQFEELKNEIAIAEELRFDGVAVEDVANQPQSSN